MIGVDAILGDAKLQERLALGGRILPTSLLYLSVLSDFYSEMSVVCLAQKRAFLCKSANRTRRPVDAALVAQIIIAPGSNPPLFYKTIEAGHLLGIL